MRHRSQSSWSLPVLVALLAADVVLGLVFGALLLGRPAARPVGQEGNSALTGPVVAAAAPVPSAPPATLPATATGTPAGVPAGGAPDAAADAVCPSVASSARPSSDCSTSIQRNGVRLRPRKSRTTWDSGDQRVPTTRMPSNGGR